MTSTSTTLNHTQTSARRPVWRAGSTAGLVGAAVLYAYGAVADALRVPMRAGEPGAHAARAITPASFAVGVLICTFWGTLLAIVIDRRAAHPARTWIRTATALVALSLVFPLAASHAAESTRLTLAAAHMIAASIIVPAIAQRLRQR
jgi:hypothetical protein